MIFSSLLRGFKASSCLPRCTTTCCIRSFNWLRLKVDQYHFLTSHLDKGCYTAFEARKVKRNFNKEVKAVNDEECTMQLLDVNCIFRPAECALTRTTLKNHTLSARSIIHSSSTTRIIYRDVPGCTPAVLKILTRCATAIAHVSELVYC